MIQEFRTIPGLSGSTLDEGILAAWVRRAQELLRDADIEDVGIQYVGRLLAHCPADPDDGAWPATALRNLIDDLTSEHLEIGIGMERYSMRGAYSKGLYDGGADERELARLTRSWSEACAAWPRTADLLMRIAADWDRHADREDTEARQRKMRD